MTAENEVVERPGLQRTVSMVGECDKVRQRAYRYEVLQQLATLSLFGVPPPTPRCTALRRAPWIYKTRNTAHKCEIQVRSSRVLTVDEGIQEIRWRRILLKQGGMRKKKPRKGTRGPKRWEPERGSYSSSSSLKVTASHACLSRYVGQISRGRP